MQTLNKYLDYITGSLDLREALQYHYWQMLLIRKSAELRDKKMGQETESE